MTINLTQKMFVSQEILLTSINLVKHTQEPFYLQKWFDSILFSGHPVVIIFIFSGERLVNCQPNSSCTVRLRFSRPDFWSHIRLFLDRIPPTLLLTILQFQQNARNYTTVYSLTHVIRTPIIRKQMVPSEFTLKTLQENSYNSNPCNSKNHVNRTDFPVPSRNFCHAIRIFEFFEFLKLTNSTFFEFNVFNQEQLGHLADGYVCGQIS